MALLRATALLLALAAATAVAAPTGNATQIPDLPFAARQAWVQSYGRRGCDHANAVRAQYGRHRLYYSTSLTNLAARHSNWMAYYHVFTHQNLNGLGAWVGRIWLPVTAENIAMSVPRSSDAAWDAHQQWYHSPGHFANMISPYHTHCGVGVAFDAYGRWWATQLFGYTTAFGHEGGSGSAAASAPAPAAPAPAAPARAPAPAPAARASPSPRARPSSGGSDQPVSTPLANAELPTSMVGEPLSIDVNTQDLAPGGLNKK